MPFCPVGQPEWVVIRAVPSGCDRTAWLGSLGSIEALCPDSPNVNVLPHLSLSKPHTHILFFFSSLTRLGTDCRQESLESLILPCILFIFFLFIYLWLLLVCAPAHRLSPVSTSEGCALFVVCGFLIVLASVVVEHGL